MIVIRRDMTGAFKERMFAAMNAGTTAAAEVLGNTMREMIKPGGGGRSAAAGQPPNTQSGNLRNSISHSISTNLSAGAGSKSIYAKMMEFGGPIRPKPGKKFLAIPQGETARKLLRGGGNAGIGAWSGSSDNQVRGVINALAHDKSRPLRWIKTKSGNTMIVRQYPTRSGGLVRNGEPLFLLVRKVNIRPHPWVKPSVEKAKGGMRVAFEEKFVREMKGVLR